MMLLQAAADEWKVPVGELTVSNGVITHAASKRTTTYGKVAARRGQACRRPTRRAIKLKDPKDWKIAGKPVKRLDTATSSTAASSTRSTSSCRACCCAAIKDCPVFGGKLVSFDEAKIAGRPGVAARRQGQRLDRRGRRRHVVAREDRARRVADRLGRRPGAAQSSATIADAPQGGPHRARRATRCARKATRSRRSTAPRRRSKPSTATPFLAHATMEPMNCTAQDHGRPRRGLGRRRRTAKPRSRRSPRRRACRSTSARSTGTIWAAVSAGAAARRTTCARRSPSPSSFPASRSR